MKVSIIGGTGPQGLGIGERLAIAGVDVIIGSRKEEKALDVVEQAKKDLADYDISMVGMANEDAAKEGDILIITVPLAAQSQQLKESRNSVLTRLSWTQQYLWKLQSAENHSGLLTLWKDQLPKEPLPFSKVPALR